MAENSRFLRALQRIADTARRINPNPRPTPTIQATPSVLTSLPEHQPLLPLLLSHDVPPKLARACADRYDEYASQLRSGTESRLAPYLVNGSGGQPATIYSSFLKDYNRTLHRWSQSILNTALKSLKRDSVELLNWDVTHPAPLWLPLPPDSAFAHSRMEKSCPLSSVPRPAHAFPTTYPPPLRPPAGLPPVEWPCMPATSPVPHNSPVDLDSLCTRFAISLVLDENPRPSRWPVSSVFSPPITAVEVLSGGHSCTTPPGRKYPRVKGPQNLLTSQPSIPRLEFPKPRRLSAPPSFPLPSPKTKPTPRKASAPPRVSTSRRPPVSQPSKTTLHMVPTTSVSPLNTPTTASLDIYSYPGPSTPPLHSQSPLDSILGRNTHTPQGLSYSPSGPTTPPTLLPGLFSEPIVAPSSPVHLYPGSSLVPITDPFLQFLPHYDYFSDPSQTSPLDYSGSIPELATGAFSSKSAFDTPLGSDYLSHDIPTHITYDSFEHTLFDAYIAS